MKYEHSFEDGKYTLVLEDDRVTVLRYGEPWRDFVGDKFIHNLATEFFKARNSLFICPDCGYKVSFEEFIGQGDNSEAEADKGE